MKNIKKRLYDSNGQWIGTLPIVCLVLSLLAGCANVGPRSISMGRADYNEAINKTEDEQMLLSIVKGRYGETSSLLAVSGVAANINFKANAGVQAGFGPDDNYTGNLVPFSGSLAYEENPTITYTPVHGEKYLRQLLSPVPLDIFILFMRNGMYSAKPLNQLVNRINDMRNPDFLSAGDTAYDPRFQRFVELNKELNQTGVLQWVENPSKEAPFSVLIAGYNPAHSEKVNEYLTLIGLPMLMDASNDIVIPVYFGVKGSNLDGIAISTRSTYDLIQILKAAVEIPQDHVDTGLAIIFPPMGPAGDNILIHASKDEPKRAAVAVKNRGYWFYIDEADMHTKLYYLMVRTLWSVGIADAADHRAAPVLTIPVSR